MADAAAHDSIGDLWNQKTIHFLVIFTSPDQDFEIIGVGPTLPYSTLETAATHLIPNKKPEFFVKCPAAIAGRLQPKLAPGPVRSSTRSPTVPVSPPSLKGRTVVPFPRPALTMPAKAVEQAVESAEIVPPLPSAEPAGVPAPPEVTPSQLAPGATELPKPATLPLLEERERAIARREHELAILAASLKIREAALRDREAALAASEERLLNPPPKTD